ncbi:Imm1 family immunity protein [Allokutzneria sp. NRRL B-24872]|uniref:Imm1 family immunity protein n=1 Tax=Allokutzneria sp. NRRL B-24872 TaxID=1137961 RepID=UPI001178227E|nr:Imm1 family immunity protein [Allokutzneria sp. NRRL B-24872]
MSDLRLWYCVNGHSDRRDEGMLDGVEAIDSFLNRLAEGERAVMAALFRAEDLHVFPPQVEMLVGLGGGLDGGVVQCDGMHCGSAGDFEGGAVSYDYVESRRDLPASAVIPQAQVRAVLHEFAATGKRPETVVWHPIR